MKTADIVVASDFRLTGGTSAAIAAEIRAFQAKGFSIAIAPLFARFFGSEQKMHPEIQELIGKTALLQIQPGERAQCQLLLLHNPVVLQNAPLAGFSISSKYRLIIAHQVPRTQSRTFFYDPWAVHRLVTASFGEPIWAPISEVCREGFRRCAFDKPILAANWHNIVETDGWGGPRARPRFSRITIGRHSREDPEKWPSSRREFLAAYPDSPDIDVKFLGAGPLIPRMFPEPPENWVLHRFSAVKPRDFLQEVDYFVYFHHPNYVETFGRAPAEAAAAGCVLILEPYLRATFGDAALYCEPREVETIVRRLHSDWDVFAAHSRAGSGYVRSNFNGESLAKLCASVAGNPEIDGELFEKANSMLGNLKRQSLRWDNSFRWRFNNARKRLAAVFRSGKQAGNAHT